MAPKTTRRVSMNVVAAGLDIQQDRQLQQLLDVQKQYVYHAIASDPRNALPLLVAALDSKKRKHAEGQWFVASCRQFRDVKEAKVIKIPETIEPDFAAAQETKIPLAHLRIRLARSLGVKLSFRIPAAKRDEESFLAWSAVQYSLQNAPLRGWLPWKRDDCWFGLGLVYSLEKPPMFQGEERIPIRFVRLQRTGEVRELKLDDLYMDNLEDWHWINGDDEELCQLCNNEIGVSRFLGKMFKDTTRVLIDEEAARDDAETASGSSPGSACHPDLAEQTFMQQLQHLSPPPAPKTGPKRGKKHLLALAAAAKSAPAAKKSRNDDADGDSELQPRNLQAPLELAALQDGQLHDVDVHVEDPREAETDFEFDEPGNSLPFA